MSLRHYFRTPGLSAGRRRSLLELARTLHPRVEALETEVCFNVDLAGELAPEEERVLRWLLTETFEPHGFGGRPADLAFIETQSFLQPNTLMLANAKTDSFEPIKTTFS